LVADLEEGKAMLERRYAISLLLMLPGLLVVSRASAAEKVSREQIERIISGIEMKPKWREISISEKDPRSLTLHFKERPTLSEARYDAEDIATKVMRALVAEGHDPKKDWTRVYVHAEEDGLTTITGRPGVRPFGTAYYNHARDQIEWDPYRD